MNNAEIGRKIDISGVVSLFEASEGEVQHIIGKTGQGKTYEATRRAYKYLQRGSVVYTTWRLNLPEYYDQRQSLFYILKNLILFRKNFFRFDYRKNWHFVNLDDYLDEDGIFDTEKFAKFLATRTDCIFMLDEGQDTFDSHRRAGQIARQSITRTRHMHKTLIIISQRASAVDVNARNNVTFFYKCECIAYPFLPKFFRVYVTEDIDEVNSNPLWVRHDSTGKVIWHAPVYHSGFARQYVYDLYDSWYMRKNMQRSQTTHLEAYELNLKDRVSLLFNYFIKKKTLPSPIVKGVDNSTKLQVTHDNKSYIINMLWRGKEKATPTKLLKPME